jgi:hypothetical protein
MGEMTTKTNLKAARNFAQTRGFAVPAARRATVLHGCAGLRFSLTKGKRDDELVRLESNLSRFGVICGAMKSGEETAVQSPMISTFLPLSQVLEQTSQDSSREKRAMPQRSSSLMLRRNDRAERRNRKSWSAAVACA